MCAEALWWRSHRRIVADHLLAKGFFVAHVMGHGKVVPAKLTPGIGCFAMERSPTHPKRVWISTVKNDPAFWRWVGWAACAGEWPARLAYSSPGAVEVVQNGALPSVSMYAAPSEDRFRGGRLGSMSRGEPQVPLGLECPHGRGITLA